MMKVEVLKNVILLWFFRKFSKSRYDKKIEEKNKALKSSLISLTEYFNMIIKETTIEEFLLVLKIFRIEVTFYDARIIGFYNAKDHRVFTNIIEPNINNVGMNDPSCIFNYTVPLDVVDEEWNRKHYKRYLHKLDLLDLELKLFIKFLKEATRLMSILDIIKCVVSNKETLPYCLQLKSANLTPDERKIVHQLLKESI